MEILKAIAEELERGEAERARALTREAIAAGTPPAEILNRGLIAGMNVVGVRFRDREIFLPDVLMAAKAMYAGLDLLKPLLAGEGMPSRGRIVIGTVQGDLHDIGKNLVAIMLRGAGYDVIDLGNDVPTERFIATARESGASLIGMSALLTTTMTGMRKVIARIAEEGLQGKVRVIIGGAPVSADYAREIGADAYAYDAANAIERVRDLIP